MTLTKQQKILIAVLSLGLGALMVDRLVLSPDGGGATGPAGASASVAGGPGADAQVGSGVVHGRSAVAEAQALAALVAAQRNDHGVAERLAAYAADHDLRRESVRDGFRPSPQWVAPEAAPTLSDRTPTTATDPLTQFAQTHQLVAVMGGNAGVAIINGRTLRVGETIDGFRLVEVRQRSVFLAPTGQGETDGERVELRLSAQQ